MRTSLILVVLYLFGLNLGNGARILAIFPLPYVSHQAVFRELTLALNKRGHELVVVTPKPVNDPTLTNFTEIDASLLDDGDSPVNYIDVRRFTGWIYYMKRFLEYEAPLKTEAIFQHPEFQRIYSRDSNEKFDLLIVEIQIHFAFYALAARFNVPVIGIKSMGLIEYDHGALGSPMLSSHPSNWVYGRSTGFHLSFWKRLVNFIRNWINFQHHDKLYVPQQNEIAKKYLGSDIPYVGDIMKNISLVFVNQQASISYVRPHVPMVIDIGGIHLSKKAENLSKDLKSILDDATEGFIYMSLGSNTESTMLPNTTREDLLAVFSRLPHKVLWKFEDDFMPGKPENVYIAKWFPQRAILAHHNIKAFIYQGGLQSTEEAVNHAVPLIGLPVIADQDTQVSRMVSLGVARSVEIIDLNQHDFEEALRDVISNKSYKNKMLELRSITNDKPYDPLENAVWWTEFVIRHKGAPHLRCSLADETWYQQYDLDIVVFISFVVFTMFILSLVGTHRIIIHTLRSCCSPKAAGKQKTG